MIDASVAMHLNKTATLEFSLGALLSEQVEDWMRGERSPIKNFLDRFPTLRAHPKALIELINQEIVLRQVRGEAPLPADYIVDFPDLAEALSRLFEVHAALSLPAELRDVVAGERARNPIPEGPVELASAPRILGYEVMGILGHGGMGVVYLARHRALGRKVALKLLHEGRQSDRDHRARFEREAAAVAKCQHPNLVQIHEIGECDGQSYLALEYVEGMTLARSLAGVPQPPRAAAALAETLARAIDHAHSRGVVHRDLKPANVLITADGQPKITDFGLAKIDAGTTHTEVGAIMGTLAYMAPEQAVGGSAKIGPRADIHALGAILYEALTGRPPYRADSPELIYHQLVHSDVVSPSRIQTGIPRDLEAICLKCLEKSPVERYSTALELAEDLRRFQRGDPIHARRISRLRRSLKWARRHPWQTTAASTAIVAALTFIGMSYRYHLDLEAEIRRTRDQATLARLNYEQARSAIQAMLARLDDRRYADSPRQLELRHDQQEDALAFYDRILHETVSNDPAVRADIVQALNEGSRLQNSLGRTDLAENYIRRALALVESLRSERPDDLDNIRAHIDCLSKLAAYLIDSSRDQAMQFGRQAVELAEQLARMTPDDPAVRDQLAASHNNYANSFPAGQIDMALSHFQMAIEIREGIDSMRLPGVRIKLAESLINLGNALWHTRKYPAAEQSFRRAEEILLSDDTKVLTPRHLTSLVGPLNVNWSGMLNGLGRSNEALSRVDAGLSRLEPYARLEPLDEQARDLCLKLHGNRAHALAALGRHRDAAQEWTRVVELSPQPVPASYRIFLGFELLHSGELDGALTQTELVKSYPEISAADKYNLGCIFSLLARAAKKKPELSQDERSHLIDAHIAEALRWLKVAAETGFFRDPANRNNARNDSDLAILADRDEFRSLIGCDGPAP